MDKKKLGRIALNIRKNAVTAVYSAGSGHPGGSLSIADILAYLYFEQMHVDADNPYDENRDRFVLSKGHTAPAYYSVLAEKGYFSKDEIINFRKYDSFLQGHPDMKKVPGVDMSTGSLGMGLSAACGMALAARINGKKYNVYAITGDGEIQEGQIWEAAMFASHYKLSNLCLFVDNNGLQIDGSVKDVMSPYPIDEKFASFGWNVINIDGHNFDEIEKACKCFEKSEKPMAVICRTIKGKGVSFMENQASWHGKAPNKEQYEQAMGELNDALAALND